MWHLGSIRGHCFSSVSQTSALPVAGLIVRAAGSGYPPAVFSRLAGVLLPTLACHSRFLKKLTPLTNTHRQSAAGLLQLLEEASTSFCDRWHLLCLTHVRLTPFPAQVNGNCVVFIVACSEEEENEGENHLKTLQKEGIGVPACHGATGVNPVIIPGRGTGWILCIKRQTQPQSKVEPLRGAGQMQAW